MSAEGFDIRTSIRQIVDRGVLSTDQAMDSMDAIMSGTVSGAQIGALVTALRMRGETAEEIAGFAQAMRNHALKVNIASDRGPLLDTCGTGGDASGTFNISTTASFVIAAAGIRIAKHGNRAITSGCGSADLLEGLGIAVELPPEAVERCINEVGIGFMFAPAYHPAMRFVGPARREMGIRTIFNILGPLTNPAGASHQLIGVGDPAISETLATVLKQLGSRRVVLVHAEEGLDELGLAGPSRVTEFDAEVDTICSYDVVPEDFGFKRATKADLAGGSVQDNVEITNQILDGESGPRRSVTLLNAGAGIFAAGKASNIGEGIDLATRVLDSGAAARKVEELRDLTQQLASARTPS